VTWEQPLELSAEEEIDPDEQDRRHAPTVASRTRIIAAWRSTKGSN